MSSSTLVPARSAGSARPAARKGDVGKGLRDASGGESPDQEQRLSARRPRWMNQPEFRDVEQALGVRYATLEGKEPAELKALASEWSKREIGFIGHQEFSEPDSGLDIFSETLGISPTSRGTGSSEASRPVAEMPAHLGRLCEAPLLTPPQERLLFRRMNFCLHQASLHCRQLNPDRPSRVRLELIETLMRVAEWHRDRIVEANLRLVFSIVKKFVNASNQFDDLLSDGILGLIRAAEKFDFDRGFRFSTYATQVVRRNSYRAVVTKHEERQKVVGGLQDMGLDFSDDGKVPAFTEQRWTQLQGRLAVMLDRLDRREKLIIRSRFALGSHREVRTLQSLADRLGVSKERVRQLEKRAMEKLQLMADEAAE